VTWAPSSASQQFVYDFLSSLDLLQYKDIFIEEGYDSQKAVLTLTADDLKNMIIKTGHQRVILDAIRNLQGSSSTSNVVSTDSRTDSKKKEDSKEEKKSIDLKAGFKIKAYVPRILLVKDQQLLTKYDLESCCFKIRGNTRTLKLVADSVQVKNQWIAALKACASNENVSNTSSHRHS